jgi:hypothetical protein
MDALPSLNRMADRPLCHFERRWTWETTARFAIRDRRIAEGASVRRDEDARRAYGVGSVRAMARKAGPTDEDYESAARLGLLGLMAGQHSDTIMAQLASLHPRNDTFPAEILLELAAEAIAESGTSPAEPIQYEGVRDRYLPEYHFRGKSQQHKSHYALMAAAMIRAGVYPDLLDEAYGWGIDDMFEYAFYALVLYGRVAAERTGRPLEDVASALAERRGIDLGDS